MTTSNFHYTSFNAVELKLRTKYCAEIPEAGLQTQEFEEKKEAQDGETPAGEDEASPGLFNMVYSYFTPGTPDGEEAQKDYLASGQLEFDILTE